jgi:hypothetical protein
MFDFFAAYLGTKTGRAEHSGEPLEPAGPYLVC